MKQLSERVKEREITAAFETGLQMQQQIFMENYCVSVPGDKKMLIGRPYLTGQARHIPIEV